MDGLGATFSGIGFRKRGSLHPILKELGVEQTGFHAMRRFRTTWLRKNQAPEDFIKFWLGHAKESVTDSYSKMADDEDFRKEVAVKIETGFALPASMRFMRPKIPVERRAAVVA